MPTPPRVIPIAVTLVPLLGGCSTLDEGRPANAEEATEAACADFDRYIHVRLDPSQPDGIGRPAPEMHAALKSHIRPLTRSRHDRLGAAFERLTKAEGPPGVPLNDDDRGNQVRGMSWNAAVDLAATECGLTDYVQAARAAERQQP